MHDDQELRDLGEKVARGLTEAYRELVKYKKYKNAPLIVSRNGKIVAIPPDEIPPETKAGEAYMSKKENE